MCRAANVFPSEKLKIDDELTAFEFDAACEYVFLSRENRREIAKLKATKYTMRQAVLEAIILGFGGKLPPEEIEPEEGEERKEIQIPENAQAIKKGGKVRLG